MKEARTRCLIPARDQLTDIRNGFEMPDLSRVSSIESERADDSSTNSYNSLGDCCHRFVFLEQFQLPVIVDYYYRYFAIAKLPDTKSNTVIHYTNSIFARHVIPREVKSDNGPQYSS